MKGVDPLPCRVFRRGPVTYTYTFTSSNNPGELGGPGLLPMPPHMGFPGDAGGGPGSLDLTNLQASSSCAAERHQMLVWRSWPTSICSGES